MAGRREHAPPTCAAVCSAGARRGGVVDRVRGVVLSTMALARTYIRAYPIVSLILAGGASVVVTIFIMWLIFEHFNTIREWNERLQQVEWRPPASNPVPFGYAFNATLVLMSFARPALIRKAVADVRESKELRRAIQEVIIWNANPAADPLEDLVTQVGGVVRVITSRPDIGLHSRFAAAVLASAPNVLVMDEDMPVDEPGILELLRRQSLEPDVIHGPHCRWPSRFHPYPFFQPRFSQTRAPIVLTKMLVARRELFAQFFVYAPFLDQIARAAVPPWNGEDILLSMAVVRRNKGKLNACHSDLRSRLDDGIVTDNTAAFARNKSISAMPAHYSYRWRFTAEVFRTLGLYPNGRLFEGAPITRIKDLPLLAPLPGEPNSLLELPEGAMIELFNQPPSDDEPQGPDGSNTWKKFWKGPGSSKHLRKEEK